MLVLVWYRYETRLASMYRRSISHALVSLFVGKLELHCQLSRRFDGVCVLVAYEVKATVSM